MQNGSNVVRQIMAPMVGGAFWMKLLGVVWILSGALQVLSIVGILWAWIPIWLGILLFQAAGAAERASSDEDPAAAAEANAKLRLFFMIQGILMVVALAMLALAIVFGGFAMLAGLAGLQDLANP